MAKLNFARNKGFSMFVQHIRQFANLLHFDIHKYSSSNWRWSYDVEDYYPVDATPRWGHGKPFHPEISSILDSQRHEFSETLLTLRQYSRFLKLIPKERPPNPHTPHWNNGWFRDLDAAALVCLLAARQPRVYLEIGSGNSTKFARFTIDATSPTTKLVSVDPAPRGDINRICDQVIREPLERSPLSLFTDLGPGDFLFFDGSHRAFTNSDVTVFFLEILPRLKRGVLVHIHDIFLPADYLPSWRKRMYSEQYILAAMLLSPQPLFKTLLPNYFLCNDPSLRPLVEAVIPEEYGIPQGWSFWLEKL